MEKFFLFVLSSVSNEQRVALETRPSWHSKSEASLSYIVVDTALSVFEQLLDIILSEDEASDARVSTCSAKTMHAAQQSIHAAVRALLFFVSELKTNVFKRTTTTHLNSKRKRTRTRRRNL